MVFFFVGPFCYPSADCGFLFSAAQETRQCVQGEASPFDSGGLLKIFKIESGQTPLEMLDKHRIPLERHRELLKESLMRAFENPDDYLEGRAPYLAMTSLRNGDRRRWMHEVRIAGQVELTFHLEGVFLNQEALFDESVVDFVDWSRSNGISVTISESESWEFEQMQEQSVQYIKKRLML